MHGVWRFGTVRIWQHTYLIDESGRRKQARERSSRSILTDGITRSGWKCIFFIESNRLIASQSWWWKLRKKWSSASVRPKGIKHLTWNGHQSPPTSRTDIGITPATTQITKTKLLCIYLTKLMNNTFHEQLLELSTYKIVNLCQKCEVSDSTHRFWHMQEATTLWIRDRCHCLLQGGRAGGRATDSMLEASRLGER